MGWELSPLQDNGRIWTLLPDPRISQGHGSEMRAWLDYAESRADSESELTAKTTPLTPGLITQNYGIIIQRASRKRTKFTTLYL